MGDDIICISNTIGVLHVKHKDLAMDVAGLFLKDGQKVDVVECPWLEDNCWMLQTESQMVFTSKDSDGKQVICVVPCKKGLL